MVFNFKLCEPNSVCACVYRYDPQTDVWTAVAPMSISRDAVGVCLLGDRLYAVGGYDGQVYLNTVEAYDPLTNEWTQVRHTLMCCNTGVPKVPSV